MDDAPWRYRALYVSPDAVAFRRRRLDSRAQGQVAFPLAPIDDPALRGALLALSAPGPLPPEQALARIVDRLLTHHAVRGRERPRGAWPRASALDDAAALLRAGFATRSARRISPLAGMPPTRFVRAFRARHGLTPAAFQMTPDQPLPRPARVRRPRGRRRDRLRLLRPEPLRPLLQALHRHRPLRLPAPVPGARREVTDRTSRGRREAVRVSPVSARPAPRRPLAPRFTAIAPVAGLALASFTACAPARPPPPTPATSTAASTPAPERIRKGADGLYFLDFEGSKSKATLVEFADFTALLEVPISDEGGDARKLVDHVEEGLGCSRSSPGGSRPSRSATCSRATGTPIACRPRAVPRRARHLVTTRANFDRLKEMLPDPAAYAASPYVKFVDGETLTLSDRANAIVAQRFTQRDYPHTPTSDYLYFQLPRYDAMHVACMYSRWGGPVPVMGRELVTGREEDVFGLIQARGLRPARLASDWTARRAARSSSPSRDSRAGDPHRRPRARSWRRCSRGRRWRGSARTGRGSSRRPSRTARRARS